MATRKQRKLVEEIVKTKGNAYRAMLNTGYAESTARASTEITRSKGFLEVCKERGLTEEFLVDALVDDVNKKPQNRVGELTLGAKMLGLTEKHEVEGDITIKWEE